MGNDPEKFLFLGFNKIGDTLLQSMLFPALRARIADAAISVVCSRSSYEVLKNNPHVNELVQTELIPDRSILSFIRYFLLCRKVIADGRIDAVVCDPVNATPVTAILCRLLGVKRVYYSAPFSRGFYKVLGRGFVLVNQDAGCDTPMVRRFENLATALGGSLEKAVIGIYPDAAETKAASEYFEKCVSARGGKPLLAFVPFAAQQSTAWPVEHAAGFIRLAAGHFRIMVYGGPAGLAALESSCGMDGVCFVGSMNIRQSAFLIKKAKILVSVNTGPSHLFRWLGIPVLRIDSGKQPPGLWGYIGETGYHYIQHDVPCRPCHLVKCNVEGHPCMSKLGPDGVLERLLKI